MPTFFPQGVTPADMGAGHIYYVVNNSDTLLLADMINRFGDESYYDGSPMLYIGNTLTANVAIQAALDACMANRNDYVVVMPSDYNYGLAAGLSFTKKGVHLICPAGLVGGNLATGNTARIKQLGAGLPIATINAQAVEIAGFFLKNYPDAPHIILKGDGTEKADASNIHHNMFNMQWATNNAYPCITAYSGTDDGGAQSSIEYNLFQSGGGTGHTVAVAAVKINAQATLCRVCHNELTIGDQNIATIGFSNLAVKGHTDFNVISESGGIAAVSGGSYGGTITKAITIGPVGCAIGNRAAVATTEVLAGGTSAHSYSDNIGGATGDAGQATQLES
jgi:hypothetical protein